VLSPRQHAIDDVNVVPAVAVEIENVRRPRPTAHLCPRLERLLFEATVAAVPKQRVATGVAAVEGAYFGRRVGHEPGSRGHAQPTRAPHVAGVDIEEAVVVVIEK